ncbi:family 78 glycoside hydrolase catalytic domain [Paenibacillus roseipurpureus]|uniref:alpha-L-rhamnosidase n=1 Tax=Paenibacillus roseopurpureus TaxID=2918901 RepID=A0AA96LQK3_9BACL|nr:family 78 glycoside hydrolase catalytic domain [Paenibacillus sp. MBLB1832]WNR46185.1 family 78 glycoside hydrolase catalytic domain [Paenibacillus sp. MBLB1832]
MDKAWAATWIQHPDFIDASPVDLLYKETLPPEPFEHPVQLKHHHALFRKEFFLERVASCGVPLLLDLSADDYYKLYVNGRYVAQGPAQNYKFHYYYNQLDISPFVMEGVNVIAVHVYYQGLVNRAYSSGDLRQGLIAELKAGDEVLCQSDASWTCKRLWKYGDSQAATVGYETQYLEHIDNRLDIPGWNMPGFYDASWERAVPLAKHDYALYCQPTPVVDTYQMVPAQITILDVGHFIIDFGEEITGQVSLMASGTAGAQIEVRCGEELHEDGTVRFQMRCNCDYQEFWTLSDGEQVLENFDYKTFRYVEVISTESLVDPHSISAVVRHYPQLKGSYAVFKSQDPILQGIWDICDRALRNCTQESYLDCPSREKGQYLGDNTVIGHAHLYVSGDPRMWKKALHEFSSSSAVCPGLMAVVPGNLMQEIADFSCLWPLQLLTYYKLTGDRAFLQDMLPYAEGVVSYFNRYQREDGLIEHVKEKWNLVDWPDNLRDGYDFPLTRPVSDGCHAVMNAFYIGAIRSVQEIKDVLGIAYEDQTSALNRAFRSAFYRPEVRLFADSELTEHSSLHANVLSMFYGIAPEESVAAIVALIRQKRFSCGVYMSYFVLKSLAKVGEYGLIYELIMSDDEHSWQNMLREGATTAFEAWGKDQKWNTSLCHAWASAPISVLIEDLIGLHPLAEGWQEFGCTAHLPEGMQPFDLHLSLPTGRMKLAFDGERLVYSLQ